jgi:hypothetical protein
MAESPWETRTRYLLLRAGFPKPKCQAPVDTRLGKFWIDIGWPEQGVYLEFDGQVKYRSGSFTSDYQGDQALFNEKRRGDAIAEALGHPLIRVTAKDKPSSIVERVEKRFPASFRNERKINPLFPPLESS